MLPFKLLRALLLALLLLLHHCLLLRHLQLLFYRQLLFHVQLLLHLHMQVYNERERAQISRIEMQPRQEGDGQIHASPTQVKLSFMGIKVAQLILLLICIATIDDPANTAHRPFMSGRIAAYCYATIGGLLMYTLIYLAIGFFDDYTEWHTNILWSIVGCVMLSIAGGLLFREWSNIKSLNYWEPQAHRLEMLFTTGSFMLAIAFIYLSELVCTFRFCSSGDLPRAR